MRTVITPDALARSGFQTCELKDLHGVEADEAFLFIFPSASMINQINGDGDLLEIIEVAGDCSWVEVDAGGGGTIRLPASPEMTIYWRMWILAGEERQRPPK